MLQTSKKANTNYLAKIIRLSTFRKHNNADKLLCWTIDFQNIITNLDYKKDDLVVFFPLESAINKELISFINGFEDKTLNRDPEQRGFFNKHGRVRAISLRGEKSQGYVIPVGLLETWLEIKTSRPVTLVNDLNIEFDSYNDIIICEKYIPRQSRQQGSGLKSDRKVVKRISRLVDNQFRLHNDTENLRKNIEKINPDDIIGLHYKKHGTSWVVGNVLTKRPLSWIEKILIKLGVNISTEVYDYIYSSRKVVKNEYETKNHQHFYKTDIWAEVKEELKDKIPPGYTLYGELLGYTKNGEAIQKDYDYGCLPGDHKIYVYRITVTNVSGQVLELDDKQIQQFCDKAGLNFSDTFIYYGKAKDLYPKMSTKKHWHENFIQALERDYNEKDCYMCVNSVPEEGIILRKQDAFDYKAYKLKSFRFLQKETADLDAGVVDLETIESETLETI